MNPRTVGALAAVAVVAGLYLIARGIQSGPGDLMVAGAGVAIAGTVALIGAIMWANRA